MHDAQDPTDGDGGNGHQSRRATLRLRDAEAVATTRRDMFGDGSLLDALGGSLPAPDGTRDAPKPPAHEPSQDPTQQEPTQAEAGAVEPAEAAEEASEPAEAIEGQMEGQEDPAPEPRFTANPASFPFAQVPQSLDSIIDSFATEPVSEEPERPQPVGDGVLVPPQLASSELGSETDGTQPDETPAALPEQRAVSSIFDSLTVEPPRAEEPVGEEPLPEVPGLDMSMLGGPLPQAMERRFEAEPPPLSGEDDGTGQDIGDTWEDIGDTGEQIEAATAREAEATFDGGAAERAVEMAPPVVEMAPPVNDFDSQSFPEPAGHPLHSEPRDAPDDAESPEPPAMPPFPDAWATQAMAPFPDAATRPAFLAPLKTARAEIAPPVNDFDSQSFPEPAGHPLHSEPRDAPDDAESPEPPATPPFPAAWATRAMAPFFEAATRPPFPEYPERPDLLAARPLPEPIESELPAPEPILSASGPRYAEPETAAQPMFDAEAKIAAEASATAEVLDNLKRLLDRNAPAPEVDRYVTGLEERARRPVRDAPPPNPLGDPAQFAINERAPLMPLPAPPDKGRGKGIYILGFLTGIGLSLMAGLALYILINTG